MGTPEFTWTALLPVEREVDPQLYDDLITHWNKALVQASLTGGGSLLASAPALFRRVPAPASWREPTMGPSWPACAPQLLPLFVETERCAFLPGMWLEEVLRSSLVAGPLFDPPVQLGGAPGGFSESRRQRRGHFATVHHIWRKIRRRRWNALVSAFPTHAIGSEQMLSEAYHLLMFDALRTRASEVCLLLDRDRERNPRGLYLLDEIAKCFCGGSVEDALAILLALATDGKGRLCAVQYATDAPMLGFQYASSVISAVDRVILALRTVRSKLEARAAAWQRVEQENEARARDALAKYSARLAAETASSGHLVVTRSLSNARERAVPFLQRKLLAQRHDQKLRATIEQIDQTIWAVEQAQDNQAVMKALESGVRCAKSLQGESGSAETLSTTLDHLAEVLETNADFTQAILDDTSMNADQELSDADLEQQLASLEERLRSECQKETQRNVVTRSPRRRERRSSPTRLEESFAGDGQRSSPVAIDHDEVSREEVEKDVQRLDAALQGITLTE
ncbi:hypothetical protein CCYA_CCYA10G2833 [Cyanidiococcus yangmingshanensis]|nr:hypothetical protein CCYA_CCYA10G2833 [Cyanidiococcus yangmingshanensis]